MIFLNWMSAKPHIVARLACQGHTRNLPVTPVPGTHLVIAYDIVTTIDLLGVPVTQDHLTVWGVDMQTIDAAAKINTPKLRPVEIRCAKNIDAACNTSGISPEVAGNYSLVPMWGVSNKNCYRGAICILYPGVADQIRQMVGEDYYITMASLDECVCTPVSLCSTAQIYGFLGILSKFRHVAQVGNLTNEVYRMENGKLVVAP